uniref:Putative secreted protein n=1 Tax=Anopheles darlingi TaxID=43151 RepID=A0A2M4D548_ANODA
MLQYAPCAYCSKLLLFCFCISAATPITAQREHLMTKCSREGTSHLKTSPPNVDRIAAEDEIVKKLNRKKGRKYANSTDVIA